MGRRRIVEAISQEAALAREAALNEERHFKPVVPATQVLYDRLIRCWLEFLQWKQDENRSLSIRETPPSAGKLKLFVAYIFDSSVGLFSEHITLKSLKNKWYVFKAAYERKTQNTISEEIAQDVLQYINSVLRAKCDGVQEREKRLASQVDLTWLLTFTWCYDKYHFRHPRYKINFHYVLLLLIYTGARMGSILESSAYRGSNEGLCYKDCELIGLPTPDGEMEKVLKIRFRYRKRARQKANEHDNLNKFQCITFLEDRSCPGRCPVRQFIFCAIGDQALKGIRKYDDFRYLHVSADKHAMRFQIEESKKDMPLFRRCEEDGSISETDIMTYHELAGFLRDGGARAGFLDLWLSYHLRRGNANKMEGDMTISPTQYEQLLGHSVSVLGEFYASNISGIDVQAVVNDEPQRRDHIQKLRSMSLNFSLNVKNYLPMERHASLLKETGYAELLAKEDSLSRLKNHDCNTEKDYKSAVFERKAWFKKRYAQELKEYRSRSFNMAGVEEIERQIELGRRLEANGLPIPDEKVQPNHNLEFISPAIFKSQNTFARYFWGGPYETITHGDLQQAIQDFYSPEPFVLFYPEEGPVEGRCPFCDLLLNKIPLLGRPSHIHSCHKKRVSKLIKEKFERDCPKWCRWANCRNRSFSQKIYYLPTTFGDSIIDPQLRQAARKKEAKRAFGQRKAEEVNSISRPGTPTTRKVIAAHLKRHVDSSKDFECRWDKCSERCDSAAELRRHLFCYHQVDTYQAPYSPSFCYQHPACGWFSNIYDWDDHCKLHLKTAMPQGDLQKAYGIVFAPAFCPFHLGMEDAPASQRFQQWDNKEAFHIHLNFHIKKITSEVLTCPYPNCSVQISKEKIQEHFFDVHAITPKYWTKGRGYVLPKRDGEAQADSTDSDVEIEFGEEDGRLGEEDGRLGEEDGRLGEEEGADEWEDCSAASESA